MLLVHLINRVVRERERLIGPWDEGWRDEEMEMGEEEEVDAIRSCGCFKFSPSLRTKESPEPHQH